ncbi:hypothetical protein NO348_05470 [Hungatella hathewayi]|uniref:hypothetical protein n=1 Tax=Hungatella hathewayi TaxID=154046 RepID=UPI0020550073|nr:hypothetical protein [Hungatella hathewayi]MCQ5384260.1 hypothetical protein [Hungatella hathewayi]DAW94226.1 MAG TPA: hypothetical protein [Bacteriophage sp.]
MATNTTNYNFKKPDESDFYSVQDQNNNWDKADAALKDLDTPTFEDYSGSTTVPDAASAINSIRSKGKLSAILSNMKAAFKGACLIGQIVNNCVTNNAKLPLSAAQGKELMDLYTVLNSNLNFKTVQNYEDNSTPNAHAKLAIYPDNGAPQIVSDYGVQALATLTDFKFVGNVDGMEFGTENEKRYFVFKHSDGSKSSLEFYNNGINLVRYNPQTAQWEIIWSIPVPVK